MKEEFKVAATVLLLISELSRLMLDVMHPSSLMPFGSALSSITSRTGPRLAVPFRVVATGRVVMSTRYDRTSKFCVNEMRLR